MDHLMEEPKQVHQFLLEIDLVTGMPRWLHGPGEDQLTGEAMVTWQTLRYRYKARKEQLLHQQQEDSNPTLPVPPREERAKWH